MTHYILAHDLGTTGNKATLYDPDGKLCGAAFAGYDVLLPAPGWAEQDPHEWYRAVCESTRALLAQTGLAASEIACVTFSGQMQGIVPVDRHGMPLRHALIWMDQRATVQADQLAAKIAPERVYRITGHRLSAAYSLHKIQWIRTHQPDIYQDAHAFLCAKDALIARLTGTFVTEVSDASGMNLLDLERGTWSDEILEAAQLNPVKLPRVIRAVDIAGGLTAQAAEDMNLPVGLPVVMGGGDGACASVGAGSVRENVVYGYIGSSAWLASATSAPIYDPHMQTMTFGHVVPGLYLPIGTMQTAGAAYQWARDHIAALEKQQAETLVTNAFDLMNAVAETSPAGANDLLFLPYLAGERSPRWNPDARAVWFGLTLRHTRADMLRSVMEGVALNLCAILNCLRAQSAGNSTGQSTGINAIRMIGGGATARLWMQIMADTFDLPLIRLQTLEEATSMGAAVIGGVGMGIYPDFSIAERMNPAAETIMPNPANRAIYARLADRFEALYTALAPLYAVP